MRHVASQPDDPETKPLTEPVLLILLGLANKPAHGYALMQDIRLISKGRVRLHHANFSDSFFRKIEPPNRHITRTGCINGCGLKRVTFV